MREKSKTLSDKPFPEGFEADETSNLGGETPGAIHVELRVPLRGAFATAQWVVCGGSSTQQAHHARQFHPRSIMRRADKGSNTQTS